MPHQRALRKVPGSGSMIKQLWGLMDGMITNLIKWTGVVDATENITGDGGGGKGLPKKMGPLQKMEKNLLEKVGKGLL